MTRNNFGGLASIIIPCWSQLEFTRQCISARHYTRPPWELIVIDNGSTDGTAAYLSGVQDATAVPVTVISNRENRGFPAAINQGLQQARGEYLVLLNNDVVVTDAWLDQLVALTAAKIAKKDGLTAKGAKNAKNLRERTGKSYCADESWRAIRQRPNVTIVDFDDVISDPFAGSSVTTTPGAPLTIEPEPAASSSSSLPTAYCLLLPASSAPCRTTPRHHNLSRTCPIATSARCIGLRVLARKVSRAVVHRAQAVGILLAHETGCLRCDRRAR